MSTLDAILTVTPRALRAWVDALVEQPVKYRIDTREELASFLGVYAHETMGFTVFEENLNYSATGLMSVWPRLFPSLPVAQQYARQPQRIASYAYANRLGNGPEASEEGWLYRGRGLPQLTGKDNYRACGLALGLPLVDKPELLLVPSHGVAAGCWYWQQRGLDQVDDDTDVTAETKLVQGGSLGLHERQALRDRFYEALA